MSGFKTRYDSEEARANRELCETVNGELRRTGVVHWKTKYRGYADPSRAEDKGHITVWGNNITDVDAFLLKKDGTKAPCFVVGGDNLHDPSVLCDMSMLNACVEDPDGSNSRMVEADGSKITVASVARNFGKYFKHLGVAEETNMLGGFKNCTLRFQVFIVELEVGETLEDLEEGQILITAQNYQSRADQAQNVNMLFTAQNVSVCTDASAPDEPVDLWIHGTSEDDDKLHKYAIGVEATKRMFSQTGHQSKAEAIEQIERGRSVELKFIEHEDMVKMCSIMHFQFPCKKKPMRPATISPDLLIGAAMTALQKGYRSLCTDLAPDEEEEDEYDHLEDVPSYRSEAATPSSAIFRSTADADDDEDMEAETSILRSLSSERSPAHKKARAKPPSPPKESCRAASTHRGADQGIAPPLNQTDLEPDDSGTAGIPTGTFSIFMVKPKGTKFGTEDVKNAITLAEKVRKCAGEVHARNHKSMKDAGATTDSLTVQAAVEIAETIKAIGHKPRKAGLPAGVVF